MAKKRVSKGAAPASKRAKAVEKKSEVKDDSKKVELLPPPIIERMASDVIDEHKFNNLAALLQQLELTKSKLLNEEDSETDSVEAALNGLSKAFQFLIMHRMMDQTKDEKKNIVASWIKDKYEKFRAYLCWLVNTRLAEESKLQTEAVTIFLDLVKEETEVRNAFAIDTYQELVHALVSSNAGTGLRNPVIYAFFVHYLEYEDLQVNFFHDALAEKLEEWSGLEGPTKDRIFSNFFAFLSDQLLEEDEEDSGNFTSAEPVSDDYKGFKENFQKCFLAAVRMPDLSADQYKLMLNSMPRCILPYLSSPASLMDFLTDSFDQEEDEIVPLLVINSLWELMKEYNLEYPDFFTKLYSLLTPSLLYTRYRARFFRSLDLFLSSTHLSANLVASFIKKLARLAISASAPGVVIVFPFIYNLLKRHPSCMILLQNSEGKQNPDYKDTFDEKEKNPLKTGALGSSLWELETLQSHYHPNIATLAKIFSEPFRKPSYNMEDFLDWTYKSLLDSEEKRKYKGLAALEYEEWETLFGKENAFVEGWEL
ncbi:hypothetical protein FT663_02115 [Candidozyma haemuli var. vulneris]|uniref:CCAAT-binding factor domain-containing protein n=1 Tax=Candidozyma haemuli TaxID=45357 RepID=A0A2V1AS95_9ASCO|nr:hypothetical protein CXQ85_001945 [[Candida] haemuloni]KAF3985868.1 hypothetical protein FT662_04889 [[Candida] haemuloni var. vulneris]KAF3992956.1 hypothetical protein FT663_02115 [[Candida] haemuloni var. vulneris]PVH20163.1 hypothetical protein CXQ85_001945 [[Candida] haemuloni]